LLPPSAAAACANPQRHEKSHPRVAFSWAPRLA
jgi:hypothetical protein